MLALSILTKVFKSSRPTESCDADEIVSDCVLVEKEIESHLKAIELYEHKACSSDAQLREFALRILPQLQRHLALLRSLKSER